MITRFATLYRQTVFYIGKGAVNGLYLMYIR